jgi:hypothetical protein
LARGSFDLLRFLGFVRLTTLFFVSFFTTFLGFFLTSFLTSFFSFLGTTFVTLFSSLSFFSTTRRFLSSKSFFLATGAGVMTSLIGSFLTGSGVEGMTGRGLGLGGITTGFGAGGGTNLERLRLIFCSFPQSFQRSDNPLLSTLSV